MSSSAKYQSKLNKTRVLVFGGTSGIGFCIAEAAVEQGATVIVSSSNQGKIDSTITRLTTAYPEHKASISGITCDLSDLVHVEENVEKVLAFAAGDSRISHIAFTAGDALKMVPLTELTPKDIHDRSIVRFIGSLMIAKHAPKYMHSNSSSSITLTSGTNGAKPGKGWSLMAGYSAASEGVARGLAVDLAPIRVNVISPGAIHTELFDSFVPKEHIEGVLKMYAGQSLLDKVGTPEECAEAYLFAMRCDFLTGQTLQVDGGRLLK